MSAHAHVLAPLLSYAEPATPPRRSAWSAVFFFASLPGIAAIFLDFTYSTSPLDVLSSFASSARDGKIFDEWGLTLVASPFTLAIPLALWHLRMLIVPGTTRAERVVAYVLAGLCAAMTLFMATAAYWDGPSGWSDRFRMSASIPVIAVGAMVMRYAWKRSGAARHVPALLAMMIAHAANAIMLFFVFAGSDDPGYAVTAIAVALNAAIAVVLLRRL